MNQVPEVLKFSVSDMRNSIAKKLFNDRNNNIREFLNSYLFPLRNIFPHNHQIQNIGISINDSLSENTYPINLSLIKKSKIPKYIRYCPSKIELEISQNNR